MGRGLVCACRRARSGRNYVDITALVRTLDLELNSALRDREQGVVTTHGHATTRVETRATLPDDDIARRHVLTAKALHAQAFRF